MKAKKILGAIFGLISIISACLFYDWKLSVIIMLAIAGNNLERSKN